MVTYIKKGIDYVILESELSSQLYDNIGTTFEDYLNDKWVKLTESQVKFHETHPEASIKEVFNMDLEQKDVSERTIEQARQEILRMINLYDKSTSVNGFTINETIHGWFTAEERSNYKVSIDAAKLLEVNLLSFYINDYIFNITPEDAEKLLAQIQLYADQCFMVTKQHIINVKKLESIEEIDQYNYMTGYPEKLNFTL